VHACCLRNAVILTCSDVSVYTMRSSASAATMATESVTIAKKTLRKYLRVKCDVRDHSMSTLLFTVLRLRATGIDDMTCVAFHSLDR
jgi:hypothetical protein